MNESKALFLNNLNVRQINTTASQASNSKVVVNLSTSLLESSLNWLSYFNNTSNVSVPLLIPNTISYYNINSNIQNQLTKVLSINPQIINLIKTKACNIPISLDNDASLLSLQSFLNIKSSVSNTNNSSNQLVNLANFNLNDLKSLNTLSIFQQKILPNVSSNIIVSAQLVSSTTSTLSNLYSISSLKSNFIHAKNTWPFINPNLFFPGKVISLSNNNESTNLVESKKIVVAINNNSIESINSNDILDKSGATKILSSDTNLDHAKICMTSKFPALVTSNNPGLSSVNLANILANLIKTSIVLSGNVSVSKSLLSNIDKSEISNILRNKIIDEGKNKKDSLHTINSVELKTNKIQNSSSASDLLKEIAECSLKLSIQANLDASKILNSSKFSTMDFKKPAASSFAGSFSNQYDKPGIIEDIKSTTEDKQKIEFMASLNLISHNAVKDMQKRRSERKRKSTANPQFFYGHLEMEIDNVNNDLCSECKRSGELLMCDVCSSLYHLHCIDPIPNCVPSGLWSCTKCLPLGKRSNNATSHEDWNANLTRIQSLLTVKAEKEEEKKRLLNINEELLKEKLTLELKAVQLKEILVLRLHEKSQLLETCNSAQRASEQINYFVKFFNVA